MRGSEIRWQPEADPKAGATVQGERRFPIQNFGWRSYQTSLNLFGDWLIRVTFDRGDVELI